VASMVQPSDDAIARRVLTVVMGPAVRLPDETAETIVTRAAISETEVLSMLQAQADIDPPVVRCEHDASLDIELWFAIKPRASTSLDDAEAIGGVR
jgi:hypothetical protein